VYEECAENRAKFYYSLPCEKRQTRGGVGIGKLGNKLETCRSVSATYLEGLLQLKRLDGRS